MSTLPPCPQCQSEFTYEDGNLLICPSCGHEWNPAEAAAGDAEALPGAAAQVEGGLSGGMFDRVARCIP